MKSLIDAGLLDRASFERLANEALSYYVGNTGPVKRNLAEALAMFPAATSDQRRDP